MKTDHCGLIDLLAIDRDGSLMVIDLKRDKTLRDIVAQSFDYGSWVRERDDDAIATAILDRLLHHRHVINVKITNAKEKS